MTNKRIAEARLLGLGSDPQPEAMRMSSHPHSSITAPKTHYSLFARFYQWGSMLYVKAFCFSGSVEMQFAFAALLLLFSGRTAIGAGMPCSCGRLSENRHTKEKLDGNRERVKDYYSSSAE